MTSPFLQFEKKFNFSYILVEHWTFFNVHTVTVTNVRNKIEKLYEEFRKFPQTRDNRKSDACKERVRDPLIQ